MVIKFKAHEVCLPSVLQGLAQVTPRDGHISFGGVFRRTLTAGVDLDKGGSLEAGAGISPSLLPLPRPVSPCGWRALGRTQAY